MATGKTIPFRHQQRDTAIAQALIEANNPMPVVDHARGQYLFSGIGK
ncbi:MAG: hypothetical protein PHQ05_08150 [Sterolibacterium sp.]|nr:hypothetical protein [Sterolibacterium sp.]